MINNSIFALIFIDYIHYPVYIYLRMSQSYNSYIITFNIGHHNVASH